MSEKSKQFRLARCAVAVLAACAGMSAQAFEFETESGWKGNLATTVSLASSWRAENPNSKLYANGSGIYAGVGPGGTGATYTDSGNLNWDKGDRFSTPVKALVDFSIRQGDMGAFVRAKAWYDQALNDEGVRVGNANTRWARGKPLSDSSQPLLGQFDGIALLDAYVYNSFEVGGKTLQVRAGSQVVNWGESLFIQGVNQLNPLDVVALRRPGTEVKEALLPVWSLYGNLALGGGVSVEGFYQLKWAPNVIDSCGGYWSPVEFGITTGTNGTGCNFNATSLPAHTVTSFNNSNAPKFRYTEGKDGKDSGQFGLALRAPVEAIDAELGVYAMQISSRAPFISGYRRTGGPATALSAKVSWEYPDDIRIYGVSLSTNIAGWSVGAELGYTPNQPVQINGNDLLAGLAQLNGPVGATAAATTPGGRVSGYDRMDKTQFQINTIKVLPPGILGSAQGVLVGEVGMQWLDMPNNGLRYGRAFIFGGGSSPAYVNGNGGNTCTAAPAARNPQQDGCKNDGYVTDYAWGYRLRGSLDYPNVMDSGVTLTPSLFFAQDVKGYSADGQFLEDRTATTFGLKADYQKRITAEIGYTTFGNRAKYDMFRDRDFYSASVSYTF